MDEKLWEEHDTLDQKLRAISWAPVGLAQKTMSPYYRFGVTKMTYKIRKQKDIDGELFHVFKVFPDGKEIQLLTQGKFLAKYREEYMAREACQRDFSLRHEVFKLTWDVVNWKTHWPEGFLSKWSPQLRQGVIATGFYNEKAAVKITLQKSAAEKGYVLYAQYAPEFEMVKSDCLKFSALADLPVQVEAFQEIVAKAFKKHKIQHQLRWAQEHRKNDFPSAGQAR